MNSYENLLTKLSEEVKSGSGYNYTSVILKKLEKEGFRMTDLFVNKVANKIYIHVEVEEP